MININGIIMMKKYQVQIQTVLLPPSLGIIKFLDLSKDVKEAFYQIIFP